MRRDGRHEKARPGGWSRSGLVNAKAQSVRSKTLQRDCTLAGPAYSRLTRPNDPEGVAFECPERGRQLRRTHDSRSFWFQKMLK